MFDQTYFGEIIVSRQQEEMERRLELRRSIIERSDQIVPRADGPLRRMLRRMLPGTPRPAAGATASAPAAIPEPVCEAVPAR